MLYRGAPSGEGQGGRLVVVALSGVRLGVRGRSQAQGPMMLNRGAPLGEGQGGRLVVVAWLRLGSAAG